MFAVLYTLAGDVAREGTVTEAFTWLGTGLSVGLAAGSAVGGALSASSGARAGFLAAAASAALAAAIAAARARDLAPHTGTLSSPAAGAAGACSRAFRPAWQGAPERDAGTPGSPATGGRRGGR